MPNLTTRKIVLFPNEEKKRKPVECSRQASTRPSLLWSDPARHCSTLIKGDSLANIVRLARFSIGPAVFGV